MFFFSFFYHTRRMLIYLFINEKISIQLHLKIKCIKSNDKTLGTIKRDKH